MLLKSLALLTFLLAAPVASERHQVAHVSIAGPIDSDLADQFEQTVAKLNHAEVIVVEINSRGGEMEAGFRISKAIERSPVHVVCVVDGVAMSMANYILQSCDERLMTKRSVLMLHLPAVQAEGQEDDLSDAVAGLHAAGEAACQHLARRMTLTPEELLTKIEHRSWYLNAPEALQVKAVDLIVSDVPSVIVSEEAKLKPPGAE